MKKTITILLALLMVGGLSAAVLLQQGFESGASDTWGYTLSHAAATQNNPYARWEPDNELDDGGLPENLKPLPDNGNYLWNAENTEGLYSGTACSIYMNTIDLSSYSGDLTVNFYYYTFYYGQASGAWIGSNDVLNYYVEYDNGSNWDTAIALNQGTNEWTKISIDIPESSTHVRIRFEAKNNRWEEIGAFDLITLESTGGASPITLSDFSAEALTSGIKLSWTTASEKENSGFVIYRDGKSIAFIDGAGTTSETREYSYLDKTVVSGKSYTYTLADLSYDNEEKLHGDKALRLNATSSNIESASFLLEAAYPNPFNPQTTIAVNLEKAADLDLRIYNAKGQMLTVLFNGPAAAGNNSFVWNAQNMQSGVYILKAVAAGQIETQKLLLVK